MKNQLKHITTAFLLLGFTVCSCTSTAKVPTSTNHEQFRKNKTPQITSIEGSELQHPKDRDAHYEKCRDAVLATCTAPEAGHKSGWLKETTPCVPVAIKSYRIRGSHSILSVEKSPSGESAPYYITVRSEKGDLIKKEPSYFRTIQMVEYKPSFIPTNIGKKAMVVYLSPEGKGIVVDEYYSVDCREGDPLYFPLAPTGESSEISPVFLDGDSVLNALQRITPPEEYMYGWQGETPIILRSYGGVDFPSR